MPDWLTLILFVSTAAAVIITLACMASARHSARNPYERPLTDD